MALTPIQNEIVSVALSAGVDPGIALGVAKVESNFNQNAIGSSGEIGIFQLLPSTAAALGINSTDPTQNIQGGISYLAQMLSQFGDYNDALAAYNWGPGNVANSGGAIPAAVANYVAAVISAAASFSGSLAGVTSSGLLAAGAPLISTSSLGALLPSTPMGYAAWGLGLFVFLYLVIE